MENEITSINDVIVRSFLPRGKAFYETYASWVDYKAWNGDILKTYEELPMRIQIAWAMAARLQKKVDGKWPEKETITSEKD